VILWCDGAHAPEENMRRDEALLAALEAASALRPAGDAHPEAVLRLFRFAPHGITLGRAQTERALDLERCRLDGVPWALRPTGGRAIFHAEEWTYSLTAAIVDPEWGGSLSHAYERSSTLLLRALVRLGVPAAFAPRGGAPRAGHDRSGAACFAATARHEIVLAGRKLAGSAQRRTARALLQQGSVLLGPGHERLADYLDLPEAERAALRATLAASATHAGGVLGAGPPLERWADALMAELPAGTRRCDGALGVSLLTPAEAGSYTAHAH
jgi:lipoate-protein ligase A